MLPCGPYKVVFSNVTGWNCPPATNVYVTGGTTVVNGVYSRIPTNSLVLHYTFSETGGVIVCDSSEYGNHGTNYGAVVGPADGLCGDGAYSFNGSNTYLLVPSSLSFDRSNFTVSVWAQTVISNTVADRAILGKHREGYNYNYFWMYQHADTIEACMIGDDIGHFSHLSAPLDAIYGQWGMVTLTYDGQMMRLYVNGEETDAVEITGYKGGNPYDLLVGAGEFSMSGSMQPQRWWDGGIDDIRIYEHALSGDEILELYTSRMECFYANGPHIITISPEDGSLVMRKKPVMQIYIVSDEMLESVTVDGDPAVYDATSGMWQYAIDWEKQEEYVRTFVVRVEDVNGDSQEKNRNLSSGGAFDFEGYVGWLLACTESQ